MRAGASQETLNLAIGLPGLGTNFRIDALASFFLIVGPVGVPVNTLVGEENGLDATQVSRKAAFRMLNALQNVRGYRIRLKNECAISLQKFAGMCKGESIVGALPAAIAGRQKSLLKELLESVGKVLGCE